MGHTHGTDAENRPIDLIGKPMEFRLTPTPGTGVGVRVVGQQEIPTMGKAEHAGEYVLNGNHFVIKAGDNLPDGAEMVDDKPATRAKPAAPENKARQAAPETKAKGKE